jgi:serine/threonine-protein kinase HipA
VLLNGGHIGTLDQDPHGQLSFAYDESYRRWRGSTPLSLSLSMPLPQRTHGNDVVEPYLRGLLPDNENVLRQLGRAPGRSVEQSPT